MYRTFLRLYIFAWDLGPRKYQHTAACSYNSVIMLQYYSFS